MERLNMRTKKDNEIIPLGEDSEEKKCKILQFEKNLKFNKHITVTVKRANTLVGLIKRTFSYMDK